MSVGICSCDTIDLHPVSECVRPGATAEQVAQDDVRALLEVLGIGTHARPYSAHAVIHREILPALRRRLAPRISLQLHQELMEVVDALSERADEADSDELQAMADKLHALSRAATYGMCTDCGSYDGCNCDAMADQLATGGY